MDEKLSNYINYIKEKYPSIEVSSIQTNLTDGLHNDIVIINGNEVFRFAKNDFSKELLLRACLKTNHIEATSTESSRKRERQSLKSF
ncbi:aminoglycoside phosphotransferase, partial [Paenibacillus sp. FSL R7-269]